MLIDIINISIGAVVVLNVLIWSAILLLPWKPWDTAQHLDAAPHLADSDLSDVTVLIPARNEEKTIGECLTSLMNQGTGLKIILVNDQSWDRTTEIAQEICGDSIKIIRGLELPRGWTGKLWALDQGLKHVTTGHTLLLDADIRMEPGTIATALAAKEQHGLNMFSLMAWLSMENFWEKLMMPAFVYFFKLIYPFRLANFKKSRVAAAAGGFILVDTEALKKIKAFECIKGELIDDCALARKLKAAGFSTWTGLTHSVTSIRKYEGLGEIWDMVARTAYTQLRQSFFLLICVTFLMIVLFWGHIAGLIYGSIAIWVLSWVGFTLMLISYSPTLSYYRLSFAWSMALPLTATLYLMMTWSSAFRHWRGHGGAWKDREYS
jgi:hopene-associated glycosyltransferase HpnB